MAELARGAALLALIPVALGRFVHDPRPTQTKYATDQFDFEWGWTPKPTARPDVFGRLSRRQGIAPNSTCGFINGLSTSVLTCNDGLDCGFNSGYDAAGCCSGYTLVGSEYTLTACDFFTACYDSTAVSASCDTACQSNTHNLQCTGNDQPYCITWSFTDIGYTNLGCYQFSGLTEYLAITYNAPTNTTTTSPSSPIVITDGPTTTSLSSSSTTSSTPIPPPVVFTTSSTSSTPASIASGSPSTAAGTTSSESAGAPGAVTANTVSTGSFAGTTTDTATGSGSSGSGSSSAQSTSHSSSNTGAIAGGVVGGVVGLAIIAGLIGFFIRRRKKNGTGPPSPAEVSQHMSMQYPHSPVSPATQTTSQYGSPQQVHEFPATPVGAYSHPMDHPQSGYQPGQYNQAHEVSSEGTGSSQPLNQGYSYAPEVVPQGGYRGVDPTGGGYSNPSASYGAQPGNYGRPYTEMP